MKFVFGIFLALVVAQAYGGQQAGSDPVKQCEKNVEAQLLAIDTGFDLEKYKPRPENLTREDILKFKSTHGCGETEAEIKKRLSQYRATQVGQ